MRRILMPIKFKYCGSFKYFTCPNCDKISATPRTSKTHLCKKCGNIFREEIE